jgi:hypothetical protein
MKSHRIFNRGLACAIVTAMLVSSFAGCSRREEKEAAERRQKELDACRQKISESHLVPIIGGGHLDAKKLGIFFNVRVENGECGTDGFEGGFYWHDGSIEPASHPGANLAYEKNPTSWKRFEVRARLGNQRKGRECTEQGERCSTFNHKNPGLPPTWPEDRIVRPKAYPGLEIWLPEKIVPNHTESMTFVIPDWPRADGSPRTVNCWSLPKGYALDKMSRQDLEAIDFSKGTKHGYPCDVEFWDFSFTGGAARVHTGTESLVGITRALKALEQHISNAVTREDEK